MRVAYISLAVAFALLPFAGCSSAPASGAPSEVRHLSVVQATDKVVKSILTGDAVGFGRLTSARADFSISDAAGTLVTLSPSVNQTNSPNATTFADVEKALQTYRIKGSPTRSLTITSFDAWVWYGNSEVHVTFDNEDPKLVASLGYTTDPYPDTNADTKNVCPNGVLKGVSS